MNIREMVEGIERDTLVARATKSADTRVDVHEGDDPAVLVPVGPLEQLQRALAVTRLKPSAEAGC